MSAMVSKDWLEWKGGWVAYHREDGKASSAFGLIRQEASSHRVAGPQQRAYLILTEATSSRV